MLRYEMKKIFVKPMNKIIVVLLVLITFVMGFLTIRDVRYLEENGSQLSGIAAACRLKEDKSRWRGYLTEDVLRQAAEENSHIHSVSQDADEGYQKRQGLTDIRELLNVAFCDYGDYDYYKADSIAPEEAAGLYERRITQLEEWLDADEDHLSDAEKDFLTGQYKKLETPFYYEYADGWTALMDSQYLPTIMIILVVLAGFLVAGIFSDEFQLKADAVFFSSKLGRNRAVRAKIGAGVLSVTAVYWGIILLYSLLVLCALGFGGAECPIQSRYANWDSIYNFTYLQDYLFAAIGGYAGCLFILMFAMFLSAKLRSTVIAAAVPFALSCVPMFLGRISLLSGVMTLFPDQLLRMNKSLDAIVLYQIGGRVVGYLVLIVPVYFVLCLILAPVLYGVYRRA